jgi:hypothetical protein
MPQGIKGWAISIGSWTVFTIVGHFIFKLADNALLTWVDNQIAIFLGFSQPQAATIISWALIAFIVFVMLLTYHVRQQEETLIGSATVSLRASHFYKGHSDFMDFISKIAVLHLDAGKVFQDVDPALMTKTGLARGRVFRLTDAGIRHAEWLAKDCIERA